jgi:hypothetical protein
MKVAHGSPHHITAIQALMKTLERVIQNNILLSTKQRESLHQSLLDSV